MAVGTFVMFIVYHFTVMSPGWSFSLLQLPQQLFPYKTQHKARPERHLCGHLDTLEALSSFTNRPISTLCSRGNHGRTPLSLWLLLKTLQIKTFHLLEP